MKSCSDLYRFMLFCINYVEKLITEHIRHKMLAINANITVHRYDKCVWSHMMSKQGWRVCFQPSSRVPMPFFPCSSFNSIVKNTILSSLDHSSHMDLDGWISTLIFHWCGRVIMHMYDAVVRALYPRQVSWYSLGYMSSSWLCLYRTTALLPAPP